MQLQLEVLDLEVAHFVQYRPASTWTEEEFDVAVVQRDREWFRRSLPVFRLFYEEWQGLKAVLEGPEGPAQALQQQLDEEFHGRRSSQARRPRLPPAHGQLFTTPYSPLPAGAPDAFCEDRLAALDGGVVEHEGDEGRERHAVQ